MFRFGLVRVAGWLLCYMFFFFKQKTAYEVRISDWSSDVCSSDLLRLPHELAGRAVLETRHGTGGVDLVLQASGGIVEPIATPALGILDHPQPVGIVVDMARRALHAVAGQRHAGQRSEEHTSELQSLMRISYAVFCLKKKKTQSYTYELVTRSK